MLNDWKPQDLIALVIIIGFIFLTFNGVISPLTDLMGVIVGFYFGHKIGSSTDGS